MDTAVAAAPTTPASAPAPAAAPTPAPELRSVSDVLASLTAPNPAYPAEAQDVVMIQPPAAGAAPEGVAPDGAQATDLEEVPSETAPVEGEPAPAEDTPEPPLYEAVDGSVFRMKGPDGKYTGIPETMGHIEFQVRTPSGESKTYVKSPAELVAMARRAVGSEQAVERVKTEAQQVAELNQSFQQLMQEVFADPSGEAWARRRDEFLHLTGPEARAQRAESALQRIERERVEAAQQQQVASWYATTVQPALDTAWRVAPDVTDEAKLGKLNLLTAHLTVNGVVPPERRGEFAEVVAGPFAQWAKQEQARIGSYTAAARKEQEAAAAARRAAQSAVNEVGRAVAPVGRAAPDVPARAKPKNVNEALEFAIRGHGGR